MNLYQTVDKSNGPRWTEALHGGHQRYRDDDRREKRTMSAQPIDYRNDARRNEYRRTHSERENNTLMGRMKPGNGWSSDGCKEKT